MILGVEIALFVVGIMAIVQGKLKLGKGKVVVGTPARLLGFIGLLPIPLAIVAGIAVAAYMAFSGRPVNEDTLRMPLVVTEAACVIGCAILMYGLGRFFASTPVPFELPLDDGYRPGEVDRSSSPSPSTDITDRPLLPPRSDDRIQS